MKFAVFQEFRAPWKLGITGRLSVALLALVAFVVVLTGGIGLYVFGTAIHKGELLEVRQSRRAFDLAIDLTARRNLALAQTIAASTQVQQLMERRDRAALHEFMRPLYRRLRQEHGIENLHFHTERLITLLRMHQPENFGDDLSGFRRILVEVNRTLTPRFGLEEGVNGLPIRGVVPVITAAGKHVGSLEVGTFIGPSFLREIAPGGTRYTLLVSRSDGFQVFASSAEGKHRALSDAQLREAEQGRTWKVAGACGAATGECLVAAQPLQDYAGRVIGAVEILVDVSAIDADYRALWFYLAVGLVLLLGGSLGTALVLGSRFTAPLRDLTQAAEGLTGQHLDSGVPHTDRQDEIGTLARALEVSRRHAQALREAERAIRASQERLRVALATIDMAVFNQDLELRYTWMFQPQLGYTFDAVVGKTDFELLPLEAARQAVAIKRRALGIQDRVAGEVEVILGDRKTIYELAVEPARAEDGAITGIIGASLDITSRKRIDAELQSSRKLLETIFDTIPFGLVVKDLEGRYLMVNAAEAAFYGVSPAEPVGRTVFDMRLETPDQAQKIRDQDLLTLERGARTEFPDYVRTNSRGEARHLRATKVPLRNAAGEAIGLLGVTEDVTERKKSEESLRRSEERLAQSQKLEALGQLVGGVAHDFNNMLTVIMGAAEMLRRAAPAAGELANLIRMISEASDRASDLTRRLLTFARRHELTAVPVDLGASIGGMEPLLRRSLGEDIAIRIVTPEQLWPALVDASMFEHALLNLAVNARDAMPNGGRLTVETRNAVLDETYAANHPDARAGEYVLVEVRDTGTGMSPEVRQRAFDPFFTTKETGKGTGLGLSMVYGFVRQSGGHVWLYSELGLGTTVQMYLPRAHGTGVAATPVAVEESPRGGNELILVVEDDGLVRASAVSLLAHLGYRTLTAENGAEALKVLAREPGIQLLFTDVVMPGGVSGLDLANQAVALRPGLPVLLASGYSEERFAKDGVLPAGMLLLGKPYGPTELARKIHAALQQAKPHP